MFNNYDGASWTMHSAKTNIDLNNLPYSAST